MLEFVLRDVLQHLATKLFQGFVHLAEKFQSGIANLAVDHAAIRLRARARDKATFLQTIQKARNIGIPGDHALANFTARQTIRPCAPENTESVVLRTSQTEFLELGFDARLERVGRA